MAMAIVIFFGLLCPLSMKVLTFSQQCHVCPSSNHFDPPPLQDCEIFGGEGAEKRFQCEGTERLFKVLTIVFAIPF